MTFKDRKKAFVITGIVLGAYIGFYLLDAVFGGYDPKHTSDGRLRWSYGLLVHDCIMWQPRLGHYYNEYRHDNIGLFFYPLIRLDQQFIHKTHSVGDDDFGKWWSSLKEKDIHPLYRKDYLTWKEKELKK